MKLKFIIPVIILCIILGLSSLSLLFKKSPSMEDPDLFVKAIPTLSENFIFGVDISSIIALESSGVTFKDTSGKATDLFALLEEADYNYVRVRIWNNPYDSEGNGFGGGVNDISKAITIGKRATKSNMKLLVDFHYSDFWADPAKQKEPVAWENMTLEEKSTALYQYTYDSLAAMLDEKVDIGIVQIGNETTNGMSGETNWKNIAILMQSGSKAVKDINSKYDKSIQIAVHFTNPEKEESYIRYADILENFDVEYDIFASSYYPYWHGTLENLTEVLSLITQQYGKKVMIAETSYAYTFENGDAHPNTVYSDVPFEFTYPVSVQGQSYFLQDLTAAVSNIGEDALGIFYWEPAWIGLPSLSETEQSENWEKHGSGWASSFAKSYDPKDAGVWFGGSSWDNQALFDFEGAPLDSLYTFKYIREGLTTQRKVETINPISFKVRKDESLTLPETVDVYFNDDSTEAKSVVWDLNNFKTDTLGDFIINGTVEGFDMKAVANVQIVLPNFVDNESFETGDINPYTIENIDGITTELGVVEKVTDSKSGTHNLHFYSTNDVHFKVEQTIENLKPGTYVFSLALQGGDANNAEMYLYANTSDKTYRVDTGVDGWNNWQQPTINDIEVTDGKVTIGIYIKCDAKGWGTLDDFSLVKKMD